MPLSAGELFEQVFFGYARRRTQELTDANGRFVHYTSAEAAMNILRSRQMWMRKATAMNDRAEIEHGLFCLRTAFNSAIGARFWGIAEAISPGITNQCAEMLDQHVPGFRLATYLACVSEHDEDEDDLGRLSMWRGYGTHTGVALVLNPGVFLRPSDALSAYTSPVAYFSPDEFVAEFETIVTALEQHEDGYRLIGADVLRSQIFHCLRFAALSTKHPGFKEEREWRIIHSPNLQPSKRLLRDHVSVRGVPQRIYKIPLEDVPEEGFKGASPDGLINRVIVGPSENPILIGEALVDLMADAGVRDPNDRMAVSQIPLR